MSIMSKGLKSLPVISSTSLPKPPSKMAFEPLALADAMHSEMGRPERFGDLIVATVDGHTPRALPRLSATFARMAWGANFGVADVERSHITMILRWRGLVRPRELKSQTSSTPEKRSNQLSY